MKRPAKAVGTLVLNRHNTLTGARYPMQVFVDGDYQRDLKNGETASLELEIGTHHVELAGGGLKGSIEVTLPEDGKAVADAYFSGLGVFGGGLVVEGRRGIFVETPAPRPSLLKFALAWVVGLVFFAIFLLVFYR